MGFFVSIPFSDLLLRSVSSNMVLEADNHFLLSVLGAILVVIVILLYAFRCTKLVKKSSPIDAIRSGQTGERYIYNLQSRGYESQRVSDFMGNHGYNRLMVFKEL